MAPPEDFTIEYTVGPACPSEDGPYHWWMCDGPFTVTCENCHADGRITVVSDGT